MTSAHDLEQELALARTVLSAYVKGDVGRRDRARIEKMLRGFAVDPRLTAEQRQDFALGLEGARVGGGPR